MKRIIASCLLAIGLLIGAGTYAQTPPQSPPVGMSCPGDKVVWVNTSSKVYHYQGQRYFGNTAQGKFICEKAALREGDRANRNGQ